MTLKIVFDEEYDTEDLIRDTMTTSGVVDRLLYERFGNCLMGEVSADLRDQVRVHVNFVDNGKRDSYFKVTAYGSDEAMVRFRNEMCEVAGYDKIDDASIIASFLEKVSADEKKALCESAVSMDALNASLPLADLVTLIYDSYTPHDATLLVARLQHVLADRRPELASVIPLILAQLGVEDLKEA